MKKIILQFFFPFFNVFQRFFNVFIPSVLLFTIFPQLYGSYSPAIIPQLLPSYSPVIPQRLPILQRFSTIFQRFHSKCFAFYHFSPVIRHSNNVFKEMKKSLHV